MIVRLFPTAANTETGIYGHYIDTYDIFMADTNGVIVKQLTHSKGYDAEATIITRW